jgi:hypothetical protein
MFTHLIVKTIAYLENFAKNPDNLEISPPYRI